jgi:hypothetical protein
MTRNRRSRARKILDDAEAVAHLRGLSKPKKPAVTKAPIGVSHWDKEKGTWVGADGKPTTFKSTWVPGPAYTAPAKRVHIDLPTKVVTLDMDGTMEDPWACCGDTDFYGGTEKCRHLRQDTLDRAIAVRDAHGPETEFVVVSWRTDLSDIIQEWCDNVGIEVARIFTDGSPDTKLLDHVYGHNQVDFKVGIIKELQARKVKVVGSFDDNQKVIDAIAAHGVEAHLSPHLVEPKHYRLSAYPPHAKQRQFTSTRSTWDWWGDDAFPPVGTSMGRSYIGGVGGKLTPAQQLFSDQQAAKRKERDKEPRDLSYLGDRWKGVGVPSDADIATIEALEAGALGDDEVDDLWDLLMQDLPTGAIPDEDADVDLP